MTLDQLINALVTITLVEMMVAIGLMVILATTSAIVAPLLLFCLLPIVLESESITVDASKIIVTLLATQLLPLCVGPAVRHLRPVWADRPQRPANLLSKVLNLIAVTLILVAQFPQLAAIRPRVRGHVAAVGRKLDRRLAVGRGQTGHPHDDDAHHFAAQRQRRPRHRHERVCRHAGRQRRGCLWVGISRP